MKLLIQILTLILAFNVYVPIAVVAQRAEGKTAQQLREEIVKLETIELDPSTSPEVREINRTFLDQRRAELTVIASKRITALQEYRSFARATLTPNELQVVEQLIGDLQKELRHIGQGTRAVGANKQSEPVNSLAAKNESSDSPGFRQGGPNGSGVSATSFDNVAANGTGQPAPDLAEPTLPPQVKRQANPSGKQEPVNVSNPLADDIAAKIATRDAATGHWVLKEIDQDIVAQLVNGLLDPKPSDFTGDDYCIVHLVQWKKSTSDPQVVKYDSVESGWYLHRDKKWDDESSFEQKRLFGRKRFFVLAIHLNAEKSWNIQYDVKVSDRIPAPLRDIRDLAGLLTAGASAAPPLQNLWGGRMYDDTAVPSDIVLTGNVNFTNSQGKPTQDAAAFTETYINEGRYLYDVSLGMPVNGVKELQYNAEDGTVRSREVKRQNAYGFLNIFPFKVDLLGKDFLRYPHLVLGVPISGKPLDRPVVGLGLGVNKKNFLQFDIFAGVVFNRIREPRTLTAGDSATENQLESDFDSKRVRKFVIGINLPVGQFKNALTGKKKE